LSHLISEFKKNGIKKYVESKYKGNHRNMSYEEVQEILDIFTKKSEKRQKITVKDIKRLHLMKKSDMTQGRWYIYMLLKRHNW